MLADSFGRQFNYLRLSLTDVCNFRCQYCLPSGYNGTNTSRKQFLTLSEIENLMHAFHLLGVRKVRLTGGEPTLRHDFIDILKMIAAVPDIKKIALTTNGYSLSKNAADYLAAGLTHITISLDSLHPTQFKAITQTDYFYKVREAIDTCLSLGYACIKINAVLMHGLNDMPEEINAFFDFVKKNPVAIRFIELMETKDNKAHFKNHFVSTQLIADKLDKEGWKKVQRESMDGPAVEYTHADYTGKIGVISPYSAIFCQNCNRVRVSAKGELHVCLFSKNYVSLRDLLSDPSQKQNLIVRIKEAYAQKKISHFLHLGEIGRDNHFSSIGG